MPKFSNDMVRFVMMDVWSNGYVHKDLKDGFEVEERISDRGKEVKQQVKDMLVNQYGEAIMKAHNAHNKQETDRLYNEAIALMNTLSEEDKAWVCYAFAGDVYIDDADWELEDAMDDVEKGVITEGEYLTKMNLMKAMRDLYDSF